MELTQSFYFQMCGQGSEVAHNVPPAINKCKITGSGIIIIDLWEGYVCRSMHGGLD